MDNDEKKWQRIRDVIVAEGAGKAKPRISSTRTLFGIPSAVDEAIEAIVTEDEARRRAERSASGKPGCGSGAGAGDAGGAGANSAGGIGSANRGNDGVAHKAGDAGTNEA